jgi:hypothetical protein
MSDQKEEQQPPPNPHQPGHVKLAVFWIQALALWFTQAECAFAIQHMAAQFDCYCHFVTALHHKSLRLVANLKESEQSETSYDFWP